MRIHFVAPLLVAVMVSAAAASERQHHRQGHPDAARIVPSDWRAQRTDPNWRGHRYVSPDGASWFAAYSTPADSASHVDAMSSHADEQVTYQRRERDWGAISGYKESKIFYRKAVLACGGTVWHEIAFEYPASRKREMDRFVIRASQTIDHAENDSCPRPAKG